MKQTALDASGHALLKAYGLDADALKGISMFSFSAGEYVLRQGFPLEFLLLVQRGKAKVCISAHIGKNLIVCYYQSGGILGDVEMMAGRPAASASVVSVTPFVCVAIPVAQNRALMQQNVLFLNRVAAGLSEKLFQSSDGLAASVLRTSRERLCSYLAMAEHDGLITDVLADVAQSTGMSYRHLFRVMRGLCEESILQRCEAGYRILDRARLLMLAGR